jgi:hypothetical protein
MRPPRRRAERAKIASIGPACERIPQAPQWILTISPGFIHTKRLDQQSS